MYTTDLKSIKPNKVLWLATNQQNLPDVTDYGILAVN